MAYGPLVLLYKAFVAAKSIDFIFLIAFFPRKTFCGHSLEASFCDASVNTHSKSFCGIMRKKNIHIFIWIPCLSSVKQDCVLV